MKLISWNINGIRAVEKKGLKDILNQLDADVVCFQETKAQDNQVLAVFDKLGQGGFLHISSAEKKGYSGTAIWSKTKPLSINTHLEIENHTNEGRFICVEYDTFYLINVYVPNSQRELARLDYRMSWDRDLLAKMNELETKKPVILCGDLNVSHKAIDLKNPKSNYNKTPGYTEWEINGMDNYIEAGYVDSFRHFHPEKVKYSWWSYRMNARERNIGWRLDYVLVSKQFISNVQESFILNEVMGSDHCPVGIIIND